MQHERVHEVPCVDPHDLRSLVLQVRRGAGLPDVPGQGVASHSRLTRRAGCDEEVATPSVPTMYVRLRALISGAPALLAAAALAAGIAVRPVLKRMMAKLRIHRLRVHLSALSSHAATARAFSRAYRELLDGTDEEHEAAESVSCLLYTSPSPRDRQKSRMPSSA